jgi:hypothetical protein
MGEEILEINKIGNGPFFFGHGPLSHWYTVSFYDELLDIIKCFSGMIVNVPISGHESTLMLDAGGAAVFLMQTMPRTGQFPRPAFMPLYGG